MEPGQVAHEDYEYARHGTANLFLLLQALRGWRKIRITERRTALDFEEQLRQMIDEEYATAERVVLVADNLNIRTSACLYERFPLAEARRVAVKLECHYTPEHGSWLNVAECELSVQGRQCLNHHIASRDLLAQRS
jgi:hypothetical protein